MQFRCFGRRSPEDCAGDCEDDDRASGNSKGLSSSTFVNLEREMDVSVRGVSPAGPQLPRPHPGLRALPQEVGPGERGGGHEGLPRDGAALPKLQPLLLPVRTWENCFSLKNIREM